MHAKQNRKYAYDDVCKKVKYKCSYRSQLWIQHALSSRVERDYWVIQESKSFSVGCLTLISVFPFFLRLNSIELSWVSRLDRMSIRCTCKYTVWRTTCICRVFSDKTR